MDREYTPGLVSVVIPTYRRNDMLIRAIESVQQQSYDNLEILVVNDNEKNDSYSLCLYEKMEALKEDHRIRLIEQEKHINGAAARNAGIKEANGEYLAFLDDDDWWEKDKILHQLAILTHLDDSWGGVGCLMTHYKNSNLIYVSLPYKEGNIMKEVIQRRIGIGTGSLLMRRKAVDTTGYFDESLQRHQDIQFFAYFCSKNKIALLKEYQYGYDLGDNQNRPSLEKLVEIKEKFYKSIEPLLCELPKKEREIIYIMNDFEVGFGFLKRGHYCEGIKKMTKVLKRPVTIIYSLKRITDRLKGKYFKGYYLRKFSA